MSEDNFDFNDLDGLLDKPLEGNSNIVVLTKDQIVRDENQPRQRFKESKLKSLAASMDKVGQLKPIEVWPADENGKHKLRDGERRWRALEYCKTVKSLKAEIKSTPITDIVQTHHNNFGEKNDDIEMAMLCAKYKAEGWSNRKIAEECSLHESDVSRYLVIAAAPEAILSLYDKEIVENGRALWHIAQAYQVDEEATLEFIEAILQEGGTTVKKAETFKNLLKNQQKQSSPDAGEPDPAGDNEGQPEPGKEEPPSTFSSPANDSSGDEEKEKEPGANQEPSKEPVDEQGGEPEHQSNDGVVNISNIRIQLAILPVSKKGYLTKDRSKGKKGFVILDDEDEVREVNLSDITIIAIE